MNASNVPVMAFAAGTGFLGCGASFSFDGKQNT